jgi:hypothetical protein
MKRKVFTTESTEHTEKKGSGREQERVAKEGGEVI